MWGIASLLIWSLTLCESRNTIETLVKCSASGFDPKITYNNDEGLDATLRIFFGVQEDIPGCFTTVPISRNDISTIVTRTSFDERYVNEIPYQNGTLLTCNGELKNYVTDLGEERLKFETLCNIIVERTLRNFIVRERKYAQKIICYLKRRQLAQTDDTNITKIDAPKDECALGLSRCHEHATCVDTEEFYRCDCNYGYRQNGTNNCVHRCSEKSPPCPAFATCYITADSTLGCRCARGRFLKKATVDSPAKCVESSQVVQARIRLQQEYTTKYNDINSAESAALTGTVEPVLQESLERKFGDSIGGVQVTGFRPGSVVVYIRVDFASPVENAADEVANHLNEEIASGKLAFQSIGVDSSSIVKARLGPCPFDEFYRNGSCTSVVDYTRAIFTITDRNVEWSDDFHHNTSLLKNEEVKQITRKLQETLYQNIPKASALNMSVHVMSAHQLINDIKLSINIVYFHTNLLDHQEKKQFCKTMHEIKSMESEKNTAETERKYVNFKMVSYDCCASSTIGDSLFKGLYTYNSSWIDDVVVKQCQYNPLTNFTRTCKEVTEDGVKYQAEFEDGEEWELIPKCKTLSEREEIMEKLKEELVEKEICNGLSLPGRDSCVSLKTVFTQIQNLTEATSKKTDKVNVTRNETKTLAGLQTTYEVRYVKDIMENVVTKADANETVEANYDIFLAMSNVLETADNVMKEAEIKTTAASMLVRQIEDLKLKLSETVSENKSIVATTPNIAALITKVPENIINENETKTDSEAEPPFQIIVKETEISTHIELDEVVITAPIVATVSIPKSTFRNVTDFKGKVNIVAYRKPTLFKNIENEERGIQEVDSVVVSISLSKNETAKGNPAIRLNFTKRNGATDNVVCAYWEVVKDDNGKISGGYWSTQGCYMEGKSKDGTVINCACNHFTNFALIMSPEVNEVEKTQLEITIISYIGAILSLFGLVATIIAHTIALIKGRSADIAANRGTRLPSKILVSFAVSLSILLIIFLCGMDETSGVIGCAVVAGLMQYFMLAVFIWMLVNAVSIYHAVVLVFHRNRTGEKRFFLTASTCAWGLPAIIVLISGVSRPSNYKPNENKHYCFVDGYPFYFGVILPAAAIIATNLIILIIVTLTLARRPITAIVGWKSKVRIALGCTVLLGITWVLGLFAVGQLTYTFQLLFCIFNSLQGFFIFLFYTVYNDALRKKIFSRASNLSRSNVTSTSSNIAASREEHPGSSSYRAGRQGEGERVEPGELAEEVDVQQDDVKAPQSSKPHRHRHRIRDSAI